MNKCLFYFLHGILMRRMFIVLAITGIFSSFPVYSDSTHSVTETLVENNLIPNSSDIDNKITSSTHTTPLSNNTHIKKKILIEESRGLSAFFIIGIVINIIMAITFGWWFVRQWRQSNK